MKEEERTVMQKIKIINCLDFFEKKFFDAKKSRRKRYNRAACSNCMRARKKQNEKHLWRPIIQQFFGNSMI